MERGCVQYASEHSTHECLYNVNILDMVRRLSSDSFAIRSFRQPCCRESMGKRATVVGKAGADKKPKRQQTVAQAAQQKLRDNFKGFGHAESDVIVHESPYGEQLTLRQRLERDIEMSIQGTKDVQFIPSYYLGLRNLYRAVDAAFAALKPLDNSAPLDQNLYKAILASQNAHPDRSKMQAWMLGMRIAPQEQDVSAFFRWLIRLKSTCKTQLQLAAEGIRTILRRELHTAFATKFAVIRYWVDEVLCALLKRSRIQKVMDDRFANTNVKLLQLVMPEAKLMPVLNCKGEMTAVKEELTFLCSTSTIGQELFSVPLAHVLSSSLAAEIDKDVLEYYAGTTIVTLASLSDAIAATVGKIDAVRGCEALVGSRIVKVRWFVYELKIPVQGIAEEVTARYYAVFKSFAALHGLISAYWCEEILLNKEWTTDFKGTIDPAALDVVESARHCVKTAFDDGNISSADLAKSTLQQMQTDLLLQDPSFTIEIAMAELVTDGGVTSALHVATLRCLPSADVHVDIARSAQMLSQLVSSKVFKFSQRASQGKVEEVQKIVYHLLNDNVPDIKAEFAKCPVLASSLSSIACFCALPLPGSSHGDAGTLYGTAALDAIILNLSNKEDISLADVRPLELFLYFVAGPQRGGVDNVIKKAHAGAGASMALKKNGGGAASSSTAKVLEIAAAQKKLPTKDAAAAAAMKFFE
jgi:hypothetical protein